MGKQTLPHSRYAELVSSSYFQQCVIETLKQVQGDGLGCKLDGCGFDSDGFGIAG
jgi:hypothetical protein